MSFLNPLMLIGVLAIAIPIIIHFLNRRKFKRVMWAAMKFVKISVDQNQRRMRLEDLILLLVRCAIVALLAFALARPALKSSTADALGQAKVTSVVILDNSYSMALPGDEGNRTTFEQAQAAARTTLEALPSGSAVSLLLASDIVQGVIDEPTYDLNQARQEIDNAQVSHHATDLFPAMEKAVGILKGRADIQKEIYVITDGQASGWEQNADDIQKLIEDNKDEINLYVLRVGDKESPRNLAITKMDVFSGLTPIKESLQLEIEVANHNDKDAIDVTVGLFVKAPGDKEKSGDKLTIPKVPAGGTSSVLLYASLKKEGYHSIRAVLQNPPDDDLPADNQSLLVVRAVEEVRVLIVDGDQESTDISDHESYFLEAALSPTDEHYVKVDVKSPEQYAQGGLNRYTAVVMANVARLEPEDVTAIKNYLRQGGGLIFYPGDKTEAEYYNSELFEKQGILPSRWGGITGNDKGDDTQDEVFIEFQKRAYEHPVTALWNNPEYDLGSARTRRWYPLAEAEKTSLDVKEAGPAKVVLRFENKTESVKEADILGAPAIMEREWGEGRVFQFSSTADKTWCDLALRAKSVIPLAHRIIGSVQAHRDSGLNLRVGEPFLQPLAPHQNNSEGTVMMPAPSKAAVQTTTLRPEVLNDQPVLQYKETHRAGLYAFQLNDNSQKKLFAVQLDQRESDLRKIDDDGLPEGARIIHWAADKNFEDKVQEARVGVEYWLLIFLIVLALAGLETYLAQKFSQSA